MSKFLILVANILLVGFGVLLFIGMTASNSALSIFQPLFCPAGTTISGVRQTLQGPGRTLTPGDIVCLNADGSIAAAPSPDAVGLALMVLWCPGIVLTGLSVAMLYARSIRRRGDTESLEPALAGAPSAGLTDRMEELQRARHGPDYAGGIRPQAPGTARQFLSVDFV